MAARDDDRIVRLDTSRGGAGGINGEIGARIKAYRNRSGLTQAELGRRVGLSQQQIQKYEKGQDRVPVDKLQLVCGALEIDASAIYRALDAVPLEQAGFAEAGAPFETGDFATREIASLVRAFQQIENKTVRKRVLDLVRALGTQESGTQESGPQEPGRD